MVDCGQVWPKRQGKVVSSVYDRRPFCFFQSVRLARDALRGCDWSGANAMNPHRPTLESLQTWNDVADILQHCDMIDLHPTTPHHMRMVLEDSTVPLNPWECTAIIGDDMLHIECCGNRFGFYIVIRDEWDDKEKSYKKVFAHRLIYPPTRRGLRAVAFAQVGCMRHLVHWHCFGSTLSCKATPWR